MAPRTLASTWRQFERLSKLYCKTNPPDPKAINGLRELAEKANRSRIGDALATIFVHRYGGMEDARVEFDCGEESGFSDVPASYNAETDTISVNPVGIMKFMMSCTAAPETLKTAGARESLEVYRIQAFQAELSKLPGQLLLFLLVLREVASASAISEVEKKSGGIETVEDGGYMELLWAFKELERVFHEMKGILIRSEYTIAWYESDWFVGKK
ncbi:MAG: hypothetical protein KAI66_17080 [Lentisphaeria bacterium]|nr:hypothetical protein [Lentisphaeria bacterium]